MTKLRLPHLMAALALIGLGDSSYLTAHHYLGAPLRCGVGFDCTAVTSSAYSLWFHVPVALFGAMYYLTILVLSLLALEAGPSFADHLRQGFVGQEASEGKAQQFACALTVIGFLASAWFVFVQAFVLHQWCEWCLGSAVTSTLLLGCGVWGLRIFYRGR